MKIAYFLISSMVAVSAALGAAIATVHQSAPAPRPTPIASVSPTPTPSLAPPSGEAVVSPTPALERPVSTPEPTPEPTPTPEPLSSRSPVTINGIGSVRVGMTIAQAEAAAGIPIRSAGESGNESCLYFRPQGIEGLLFMVTEGRISRVDVVRGSSIATLSGAGIGNTKAEIEAMYPGQIEVLPHEYIPGGHYLMFVPNDAADRDYRLVFETNEKGIVTQFRSGKLSEVTWVEGCS